MRSKAFSLGNAEEISTKETQGRTPCHLAEGQGCAVHSSQPPSWVCQGTETHTGSACPPDRAGQNTLEVSLFYRVLGSTGNWVPPSLLLSPVSPRAP